MVNGLKRCKIGNRKSSEITTVIQETDGSGSPLGWRRAEWREGSGVLKKEAELTGLRSSSALGQEDKRGAQDDCQVAVVGTWVKSGVAY